MHMLALAMQLGKHTGMQHDECDFCANDGDCSDDHFCDIKTEGETKNMCRLKFDNGGWCNSNNICKSGHCDLKSHECDQCTHTDQCGMDGTMFCDTKAPVGSGVRNTCREKFALGGWCNESELCQSGYCDMGQYKCAKCTNHDQCSDDEFCDYEGVCQTKSATHPD